MLSLLLAIIVAGLVSFGLALAVKRRWPDWSKGRTAAMASLPLPILMTLWSAVFVVHAMTNRRCGIDDCGLAMMTGIALAILAAVLWLVGFAVAWLWLRSRR
jgi:predicted transporter